MPRPLKVYSPALVASVRALYAENKTQAEVAAELGVTQKIVWSLMRRHGIKARAAVVLNYRGSAHHHWKGDAAGKQAFHSRLYTQHGKPGRCSRCGTTTAKRYDYANLTGRYEDPGDYTPMCRSCHSKYDKKYLNFSGQRT